jgi:hypothetical protein
MICINTPLGIHPEYFFPEQTGRDYELSPYLEVIKEFRNDFTVISGLSHPDVGPTHASQNSYLTAAPHPERTAGFRNSISLDQFAAEHLLGETRYSTLSLGCEGSGLSWTRSGAPVPADVSPAATFARRGGSSRASPVRRKGLVRARTLPSSISASSRTVADAEDPSLDAR